MNKSPAFQWYPKDILSSARVQMMSLTEECAYRRLIDFCWINGSVPTDIAKAARLVGKGCSTETVKTVLGMFIPHPNDSEKLVHERLEVEREKQAENSRVRIAAAEARWHKQGTSSDARGKQVIPPTNANAMQTDMQNDALHISSSSSSADKDNKQTGTGLSYPSLDGVKANGERIGMSTADSEAFWNHFEASGWIDKNGHAIRNWQSKQATWKVGNQCRIHEINHHKSHVKNEMSPTTAAIQANKEYERAIARIAQLSNGAAMDAMGKKYYTPKDQNEIKMLRKRRDELKKQLGIII